MTISLYDKLYYTATYSTIRWYILHATLSSDQICPMHLKYHGQISQDSFLISISFQQSRICCACGKSHGHGQSKMTVVMGNAYCLLCIFYAHGNSHAHAHAYSHGHAHDYVHGHVYYWQTCPPEIHPTQQHGAKSVFGVFLVFQQASTCYSYITINCSKWWRRLLLGQSERILDSRF